MSKGEDMDFLDPPKLLNPDLIYRFWKYKGSRGILKHDTRYGVWHYIVKVPGCAEIRFAKNPKIILENMKFKWQNNPYIYE